MEPGPYVLRGVGTAPALRAGDDRPGCRDTGESGQTDDLPHVHVRTLPIVTGARLSLPQAVDHSRTGDIWLFRGPSLADRAIRTATNSPVNHVGMAVVLEDMPPLLWHAELGKGLQDVWSGTHHRGVQLHILHDAVVQWATRYNQRAWLRQLDPEATREMEDAVLRVIARLDGTPFPSTVGLAVSWLKGRRRWRQDGASIEAAYCAEVVATTYKAMGLLPASRPANWYDPGRFWSGDRLELEGGARLSDEIEVAVA